MADIDPDVINDAVEDALKNYDVKDIQGVTADVLSEINKTIIQKYPSFSPVTVEQVQTYVKAKNNAIEASRYSSTEYNNFLTDTIDAMADMIEPNGSQNAKIVEALKVEVTKNVQVQADEFATDFIEADPNHIEGTSVTGNVDKSVTVTTNKGTITDIKANSYLTEIINKLLGENANLRVDLSKTIDKLTDLMKTRDPSIATPNGDPSFWDNFKKWMGYAYKGVTITLFLIFLAFVGYSIYAAIEWLKDYEDAHSGCFVTVTKTKDGSLVTKCKLENLTCGNNAGTICNSLYGIKCDPNDKTGCSTDFPNGITSSPKNPAIACNSSTDTPAGPGTIGGGLCSEWCGNALIVQDPTLGYTYTYSCEQSSFFDALGGAFKQLVSELTPPLDDLWDELKEPLIIAGSIIGGIVLIAFVWWIYKNFFKKEGGEGEHLKIEVAASPPPSLKMHRKYLKHG